MQIEKLKLNDIEIQMQEFQTDKLLQNLGRKVILASEWLKVENIVILSVVKSFICQYCEIADKSCLVVCQDCDEKLCQEHVQKHRDEFEYFQYKRHDNSIFHLSNTNSIIEKPLETIKQLLASYPPHRSPETPAWRSNYVIADLTDPLKTVIKNYIKTIKSIDHEIADSVNLVFFADEMTVEMQIAKIIQNVTFSKNDSINVELFNVVTALPIPPTQIINKDNFNISILNLVKTSVIVNYKMYPNRNQLRISVVMFEEQPISMVEESGKAHLEAIKQWLASYPPQRSPDIENYLQIKVAEKANLGLFKKEKTVEQQIQDTIKEAK